MQNCIFVKNFERSAMQKCILVKNLERSAMQNCIFVKNNVNTKLLKTASDLYSLFPCGNGDQANF
jgi:hypothetical protein